MARNQVKRTVREAPNLDPNQNATLQSSQRFFSTRGDDRATREARALTDAFSAGTSLFMSEKNAANQRGKDQAVQARGAGQDRIDSKNAGYNRAWDMLDAEADLNASKLELPEILQNAGAEDMQESGVQALITDYMKERFNGIDGTSAYGEIMAPGLLALEQDILEVHRQQQIDKDSVHKRTNISLNSQARLTAAGGDPTVRGEDGQNYYEYVAGQTNIFFDAEKKKVAYWETIWDHAIRSGRPELIIGSPERFANGDFTGLSDPAMAASHRAAINSANATAQKNMAAKVEANKAALNQQALDVLTAVIEGHDMSAEMVTSYAAMPGADATKVAALHKSLVAIQNQVEGGAANDFSVGSLTNDIYMGRASQSDVYEAYLDGKLGTGAYAVNQLQELSALAESQERLGKGSGSTAYTMYNADIDASYPIIKGPMGIITNPNMAELNRQAHLEYGRAREQSGFDPAKSWEDIRERFDARRERLSPTPKPIARQRHLVIADYLDNKATVEEIKATGLKPLEVIELDISEAQKNKLLDALEQKTF